MDVMNLNKMLSSHIIVLKQRDDGTKKQIMEKAKGLLQV